MNAIETYRDCNDNDLSAMVLASQGFDAHLHDASSALHVKKGRIHQQESSSSSSSKNPTDEDHKQLKSSLDGGSSCRSTPLTPLSSKSAASDVVSSQDSISSPNSPFHRSQSLILNPSTTPYYAIIYSLFISHYF